MKKTQTFLSFAYLLFQTMGGLTLHPYKTVRQLVREKWLVWMCFWPSYFWMCVVAFIVLLPNELLLYLIPFETTWVFLFIWSGFFTLIYQTFLIYLLVRFRAIFFGKKSNENVAV